MSWYVYRIYPTRPALITEGPTEAEKPALEQHFSYLEENTKKGVVLPAGLSARKQPGGLAIVIFNAESEEAAGNFMHHDPAFKAGIFRGDILPFHVALLLGVRLESLAKAYR